MLFSLRVLYDTVVRICMPHGGAYSSEWGTPQEDPGKIRKYEWHLAVAYAQQSHFFSRLFHLLKESRTPKEPGPHTCQASDPQSTGIACGSNQNHKTQLGVVAHA